MFAKYVNKMSQDQKRPTDFKKAINHDDKNYAQLKHRKPMLDKKFACVVCKTSFPSSESLMHHRVKERHHQCLYCKHNFSSSDALQVHFREKSCPE